MTLEEIARALKRIEAQNQEILRLARKLWDMENQPPAGPKFRRFPDGKLYRWLGEGTGWEEWGNRPLPKNAELIGEKPKGEKK